MRKERESQNLIFQWIEPSSSNLGRLMACFLISLLVLVALFYLVNEVETPAPPTSHVRHHVASMDLALNQGEKGFSEKGVSNAPLALLEKDLLFFGSSALGTLNPSTYELPFAQHFKTESPQPIQLQREAKQDVSTGLLVLNAPVLPPLSIESLVKKADETSSRHVSAPRIRYQITPALEKRLKGKIPEALGHQLLGSMPYVKFMMGVDNRGVTQVCLPITSLDLPADPALYQKHLRSLSFTSDRESQGLVWGQLSISLEEGS